MSESLLIFALIPGFYVIDIDLITITCITHTVNITIAAKNIVQYITCPEKERKNCLYVCAYHFILGHMCAQHDILAQELNV